ncbi:MAG TPA: peptide deformylase [Nitrospiria bacterium]|nr:peptide deformylase [Nitrospiria bacterium]
MALLKIAKLGNPILRQLAAPVTAEECETPQFQKFLDDMVETMRTLDGVGLAAPQVFQSKQAVVIESAGNTRYPNAPDLSLLILLNPVFTFISEEKQEGWEGCLSLDNLRGKVVRSLKVAVKGYDRTMRPLQLDAEGFMAVVLQHEIDHLHGKVFVDRMTDLTTLTHMAEFDKYWNKEPTTVG